MADVFGRMATIADMEAKLSASKSDTATLWETEEQALRYVLEDGKLNLCLRILATFKTAQVEARIAGTGPMVRTAPSFFLIFARTMESSIYTVYRTFFSICFTAQIHP